MDAITTNRDLYLAIVKLASSNQSGSRDLEHYLRALWGSTRQFGVRPSLSLTDFFGLLSDAFTLIAPPFDERWRSMHLDDGSNPILACLDAKMGVERQRHGADDTHGTDFAAWELFILRQIVDLREMAENGILQNELKYFGTDSPRGQRWYNFDPCTFLECGAAGYFRGWQEGDDTGREHVPGPVAVMGDDGRITSVDPRDVPDPVVPVHEVTWDDFQSFLGCGQWYE